MMMKKIIILITFLIMIISSNILFSQYQNILISNQYNPNETFIAINPKNTNQIVAGSNIFYIGSDTSISILQTADLHGIGESCIRQLQDHRVIRLL
jgi:hypothetical protein